MDQLASRMRSRLSLLVCALGTAGALAAALPAPALAATGPLPEKTLVGIKIYDRASAVLKRYGNPTKIITGTTTAAPAGAAPAQSVPGNSLPPLPSPGMPGGMPGMPGTTAPEIAQAAPSPTSAVTPATPQQVVYEYTDKNNTILDFTISASGSVIQISVAGVKDARATTSRGVTLGTLYTAVLAKYGYPESQDTAGAILTARYTEKSHVAFQFYNNRVVSITVAAVE